MESYPMAAGLNMKPPHAVKNTVDHMHISLCLNELFVGKAMPSVTASNSLCNTNLPV